LRNYQTTCNWEITGSRLVQSSTSNIVKVAKTLSTQANSASYRQWDGKLQISLLVWTSVAIRGSDMPAC